MKPSLTVGLCVLLVLSIAGCGSRDEVEAGDAMSDLIGKWEPLPTEETENAIEGISAAVEFRRDGTYQLIDECNTVTGEWSIERTGKSRVSFKPQSATDEHCVVMLGFNPDSAVLRRDLLTVSTDDDHSWSGTMQKVATPSY